jgi:DNA-binding CsgD family transcriptional regulator
MESVADEFVHAIYGAVMDAGQWKVALAKLAMLAEAPRAALMDSDFAASVAYREVLYGMDESDNHRYLRDFAAIDPRIPVALGHHKLSWLSDHDLFDETFRSTDRIYREFLVPGGVGESLFTTFSREGSRVGTALLARSAMQSKAPQPVRDALDGVMPHLDRAVRISRRFEAMATEVVMNHYVLDAMPEPLACVLADGRLHRANLAFEKMLREGGLITNRGDMLSLRDPRQQARFLCAIGDSCRIATGDTGIPGGVQLTLRIDRPNKPPAFVTIAPLAAAHLKSWAGRACALVRIDQPARERNPQRIEEAMNLSAAEARLVSALCNGGTLVEAAEKLGISTNTAKTQLASVFSKTGTTRQSELVALISTLPANC